MIGLQRVQSCKLYDLCSYYSPRLAIPHTDLLQWPIWKDGVTFRCPDCRNVGCNNQYAGREYRQGSVLYIHTGHIADRVIARTHDTHLLATHKASGTIDTCKLESKWFAWCNILIALPVMHLSSFLLSFFALLFYSVSFFLAPLSCISFPLFPSFFLSFTFSLSFNYSFPSCFLLFLTISLTSPRPRSTSLEHPRGMRTVGASIPGRVKKTLKLKLESCGSA